MVEVAIPLYKLELEMITHARNQRKLETVFPARDDGTCDVDEVLLTSLLFGFHIFVKCSKSHNKQQPG